MAITILLVGMLGFGYVLAAPIETFVPNIYPIYNASSTFPIFGNFQIGSSTQRFADLYVNNASTTNLTAFNRLLIGGTATTTIKGDSATSTFAHGIQINGTGNVCLANGNCMGVGGGSGITSLGGLTGATQTFTANGNLTIGSSGTVHTFTASSTPTFGALFATTTNPSYFMGNVGIGTAGPTGYLHIEGNPTIATVLKVKGTADTTAAIVEVLSYLNLPVFTLKQDPSTAASGIITNVSQINGLAKISLSQAGAGANSALNINSSNFQIGYEGLTQGGVIATGLSAPLTFQTNSITSMTINTAGNVGIGTTSPANLLSVHGNGLISGNLSLASLTATGTINFTNLASGQLNSNGGLLYSGATTTFSGGLNYASGNVTPDCATITGGAGLCDGVDNTGGAGGSGTVGTSTNEISGRLAYWTSNSATPALLGMVATTSETCSSPLSCGAFDVLTGGGAISISQSNGGTNGYLSSTDWTLFNNKVGSTSLSATSPLGYTAATGVFTCTNCLNTATAVNSNSGWGDLAISNSGSSYTFTLTATTSPTYGTIVATSTIRTPAIGNLTSNGFVKTGGGVGTLSVDTNTYLTTVDISANTNLGTTWPVILTGDTLSFGGLSTSTAAVLGNIPYFSGVNTFANVATGTISASGGITATASQYIIGSGLTIGCSAASGSVTGCLSSTDWTTFNNKESALTFSAPLSRSVNTISIPQATGGVDGYLSSTSWTLFNNKVGSTSLSATSPLGYTAATGVFTCTTCVTTVTGSGNIASSGGTAPDITFTGTLPIANGGTNASSFTTSGNAVYYDGTSLLTAPLGTKITIPFASTTALTVTNTASTTNLTVSALNAASCDVKSTNGVFSCGTDATGSGVFEWTPSINFATNVNSTTTPISFSNGLMASSTSRFVDLFGYGNITFPSLLSGVLVTDANGLTSASTSLGINIAPGSGGGSANATLTDSVPFDGCYAQVDSTTFAPGGAFDDFAGNRASINMLAATSSRIYCTVHIPNSYSSGGTIKWTMAATTSGNLVLDVYGTSTVPQYTPGQVGPSACQYAAGSKILLNASSTAGSRLNVTGSSVYPMISTSTAITNTLAAEGEFCAIFERSGLNASDTLKNSVFMLHPPFFEFVRKVN